MKKEYPQFVKMNGSSCLRLLRDRNGEYEYYVDGGCWEIDFCYRDDKIYSSSALPAINNKLLTPITEKEWRKANGDYAPENPEIFGYLIENETKHSLNEEQNKSKYLLIKRK